MQCPEAVGAEETAVEVEEAGLQEVTKINLHNPLQTTNGLLHVTLMYQIVSRNFASTIIRTVEELIIALTL